MNPPKRPFVLLSVILSLSFFVSNARNLADFNLSNTVPLLSPDIEPSTRRSVAEKITSLCKGFPDDPPAGSLLPKFVSAGQAVPTVAAWSSDSQAVISLTTDQKLTYVTVSNRQSQTDGPVISPLILSVGSYKVSGWVKLSNISVDSTVRVTIVTDPGASPQVTAAALGKPNCWARLEGGFTVEKRKKKASLRVEGPPEGAVLLLRSFALEPVVASTWRKEQDKRIDEIRKRDVTVKVLNPDGSPASGAWLTLTQKVSAFPFGAAVSGGFAKSRNWQQWHEKRFTWAVLENEMKWYTNERWPGDTNFQDVDDVINILEKMKQNVRGHCIFWEDVNYVQGWLQKLNKTELTAAIQRRLSTIVNRYKGRVKHWDVNNELLHGNFYEKKINKTITAWMFKETKRLDPAVMTVFNDYNLIEDYRDKHANGELAVKAVKVLQSQGAEVNIIGCQSHFRSVPNGPQIKAELDILQTGGVPLWITELDIWQEDPYVQANYFEQVMREVFSHPAVEGIMQWEVARPPCSVWQGIDRGKCLTPCTTCFVDENWRDRPIGDRYIRLRKEWSTHLKQRVGNDGSLSFRAFFGSYRATIKYLSKEYVILFDVPQGRNLTTVTLTLSE